MPITNSEDPIKIWTSLLKENKLPRKTVEQLAVFANLWLKLLRNNHVLTPALARDQILQEIADPQIQNLFDRYFFALFTLLRESALTT